MKYYLDFEFSEYFITKGFWKWKKEYHVIEPISLGMVCEDGRELEILFNDFDIDHAWNKHDLIMPEEIGDKSIKEYWLRDNVLKHLTDKAFKKMGTHGKTYHSTIYDGLKGLKYLLESEGKTKKEAAQLIKEFCQGLTPDGFMCFETRSNPEFYAYFADYDWVAFCSLFGTMMKLPTSVGFPMYCNDLKQILEDKAKQRNTTSELIKVRRDYPIQIDEHDALQDAKWNKALHQFLIKL